MEEIKHLKEEIVRIKMAHFNETADLLEKHEREKQELERSLRRKHDEEIEKFTSKMRRDRNSDMLVLKEMVDDMLIGTQNASTQSSAKPATFQMVIFHMLYSNIFSFCLIS